MKAMCQKALGLILCLGLLFCAVGCGGGATGELWKNAHYTQDTALGEGATEIKFEVVTEEKTVTFTICTDQAVLGDALLEQELIVGEELPFGLYVTEVNGMRADYDLDKAYWMLTVGGVPAATGVDGTEVTAGECYAFVYTEA